MEVSIVSVIKLSLQMSQVSSLLFQTIQHGLRGGRRALHLQPVSGICDWMYSSGNIDSKCKEPFVLVKRTI